MNDQVFTTIGKGVKTPVYPATRADMKRMRQDPKLAETCRLILQGREDLKAGLPVWTPSCMEFANHHRSVKDALKKLQRVMLDFDEKGHSQEILERALELHHAGKWHVLQVEKSVREGTHVLIKLPVGMTVDEAQKRFSEDIGFKADPALKDVARCIYLVPEDYVLYEDEELYAPEVAVDEPSVASVPTVPVKVDAVSESPSAALFPTMFKGIPYVEIVNEWFARSGGTPVMGERNNKLYALARDMRNITDNNEAHLLQVMPRFGLQENEMKALIHSACSGKFTGMPRKMASIVRMLGKDQVVEKVNDMPDAGIYSSDTPPPMPKKLPPLIELLVSRTPKTHQATVAHAVFPALATHLWQTYFTYIDNVKHEATLMNVLMSETATGKSCIDKPIERILAPIRQRDHENMARENAWKAEMQTKGANKDKSARPQGLVVQVISPDITNAAFVQKMSDAEGRFLYAKMNEIEMFDSLKGNGSRNTQFLIMCLAFDPGNEFGQDRVGVGAVNEHVTVRFNWNACTTPNQGKAYFRNVLVNGPVNRINFCTIPTREIGSKVPKYGEYDSSFDEQLRPYLDRLASARGVIACEEVRKFAEKLSKENAEMAVLMQDRVFESLSFRANVIAFLKGCILFLAHGYRWNKTMADFIRWSLQYDLWCKMHFFGEAIAQAEERGVTVNKKPGPKNLLELLPDVFTREEAHLMRQREGITTGTTQSMLDNWKHRNHIVLTGAKEADRNRQQYAKTDDYFKKFQRK